ncbi:hypothetical protein J2X65_005356 [Ancylobacter sp. 3268]|uniref:hypothetical protein n=1 Tax=Ancylobacter sp. 3268 TaxID=2817752 RepID=UPI00285F6F3B|nr:hypothetical protein [Ancylobacter sp. 3268]MDR6955969.1 hypothetical protein [Ancylobacter sp. 3268]
MNRRSFFLGLAPSLLIAKPALATSVCTLRGDTVLPDLPAIVASDPPPPPPDIFSSGPMWDEGEKMLMGADERVIALARDSLANLVRSMNVLSAGRTGWHIETWHYHGMTTMGPLPAPPMARAYVFDYHDKPFFVHNGRPRLSERHIVLLGNRME